MGRQITFLHEQISSKEGDSIITSENNYFHRQLDGVVVCHFARNVEVSTSNLAWHDIF